MRNEPNRKVRGLLYAQNQLSRKIQKLEEEIAVKETELQRRNRLRTQARIAQEQDANHRWKYHLLRLSSIATEKSLVNSTTKSTTVVTG